MASIKDEWNSNMSFTDAFNKFHSIHNGHTYVAQNTMNLLRGNDLQGFS